MMKHIRAPRALVIVLNHLVGLLPPVPCFKVNRIPFDRRQRPVRIKNTVYEYVAGFVRKVQNQPYVSAVYLAREIPTDIFRREFLEVLRFRVSPIYGRGLKSACLAA